MGQGEWLLHRSSFGAVAAAYEEHRPDYARDAVRWALEVAPGSRVLDLGAGTGKLTATLMALGVEVVAVEPDLAMLARLRGALPDVRALAGSAEVIPLPDASVDAVLAGNALHWFDMAVAGPEIARVLTPGGVLAGLWNVLDDRIDWIVGLERVSGSAVIGPRDKLSSWRAATADVYLPNADRHPPNRSESLPETGDLPSSTDIGLPTHRRASPGTGMAAPFGLPERAEFPHGQCRTADSLVATLATRAGMLVMTARERRVVLGRIRAFLAGRPETASGEFTLPMLTGVLRVRRL